MAAGSREASGVEGDDKVCFGRQVVIKFGWWKGQEARFFPHKTSKLICCCVFGQVFSSLVTVDMSAPNNIEFPKQVNNLVFDGVIP